LKLSLLVQNVILRILDQIIDVQVLVKKYMGIKVPFVSLQNLPCVIESGVQLQEIDVPTEREVGCFQQLGYVMLFVLER